jgi:hypothetical protein
MKNNNEKGKSMLRIKLPLYLILSLSAVAIYGLNYSINYMKKDEAKPLNPVETKCVNPLNIVREKDYKLTKPILLADTKSDDKKYDGIKKQIIEHIDGLIKSSAISTASVYYCEMNDGSQFNINPNESYRPTDMLEITKMIALLKQSEKNPSLLDKKITYLKKINSPTEAPKLNVALENNKSYSIRSLMYAMFANSEENATLALNPYIDTTILKGIYAAVQEPYPGVNDGNYLTTVANYSKLLKLLYNVGYLTETNCEIALELLANNSFKDGILKDLNKDIKTVHYFAENDNGNSKEMHEFAIIYLNNKNYLISIMSKGKDRKDLAALFSSISKIIFDNVNKAS